MGGDLIDVEGAVAGGGEQVRDPSLDAAGAFAQADNTYD
jgi:hypothetical protein